MAHASRSLLPAEKQYSQIEKEALGIIFSVTGFHRYLHERQFILQTDHKPLITIFGSKKGPPVYTKNRQLRWGTTLLNYNFKIEFLTSKNICYADSLSRLIPKNTEVFEESIIAILRTNLRNQKRLQEKSSRFSINPFHGKRNSRKPSRAIRNISILAIKFFFEAYKNNMTFWEVGTIKQRIGKLVYIVQGPKNTHKRHMNQRRKCRLNESEESPQNTYEEPIDAIFDLDTPQDSPEVRR